MNDLIKNAFIYAGVLILAFLGAYFGGSVGSKLSTGPALGQTNISAYGIAAPVSGGEWTAFNNLLTGEMRIVEGNLAIGSTTLESTVTAPKANLITNNSLSRFVAQGSCNNASTTLFSVSNPFGTTTQVSYYVVDFFSTGTGSPLKFYMGTTTNPSHATGTADSRLPLDPAQTTIPLRRIQLWESGSLQQGLYLTSISSTTITASSTHNNYIAASSTDITAGRISSTTFGHVPTFIVKGSEYVAGIVDDAGAKEGNAVLSGGSLSQVLSGNNTFDCRYKIEFTR